MDGRLDGWISPPSLKRQPLHPQCSSGLKKDRKPVRMWGGRAEREERRSSRGAAEEQQRRRRMQAAVMSASALLLLRGWTVGATAPAVPDNVSVTQLRANSALVTWNVPQGDPVIGYAISQQRQDGVMQRSIREVNTSSHWCVLWGLSEDTHYSVQVQSVGRHGDSPPSRAVHFRTLERGDYPGEVLEQHEAAMEGVRPHLQTGELLIITTVLLLWAGVVALFCRQYDIIKDSESTITKEMKRPLPFYHTSASSSPFQNGAAPSSGAAAPTFHLPPGNV